MHNGTTLNDANGSIWESDDLWNTGRLVHVLPRGEVKQLQHKRIYSKPWKIKCGQATKLPFIEISTHYIEPSVSYSADWHWENVFWQRWTRLKRGMTPGWAAQTRLGGGGGMLWMMGTMKTQREDAECGEIMDSHSRSIKVWWEIGYGSSLAGEVENLVWGELLSKVETLLLVAGL